MTKILGIDAGTNSLGWAIVERKEVGYQLKDKGVYIFQKGVKEDKGIESSKAAERTEYRSKRRGYYRRKVRKTRLLRVLIDAKMCPPLTREALNDWRTKGVYPQDEAFMTWQGTHDEGKGNSVENPYYYRHLCLTVKLDMNDITCRYIVGRALYHINQRRGFLSNRKDQSDESQGAVKTGINELSTAMEAAGCEYLGDYFYRLYQRGERIRNHYTARNEHFLTEVKAICEKQCLGEELTEKIIKAIFTQRPLRSQKHAVGECVFEKGKDKCPVSHPLFEEYRMLCFLNNIKLRTPMMDENSPLRPLTDTEKESVKKLFYRVSKDHFEFSDIAKAIAGKHLYGYEKDLEKKPYSFNYHPNQNVSGCPVTAGLKLIFGEDYVAGIKSKYTQVNTKSGLEKTDAQIVNDIWHALYFFDDDEKLKLFAKEKLQLSDEEANRFAKIKVPSEYASMSIKALNKILPFLRRGMIYSKAVFLANLENVVPKEKWADTNVRQRIIDGICNVVEDYDPKKEKKNLETLIEEILTETYEVTEEDIKKLYHPSQIEMYPQVKPNGNGEMRLGSPRIGAIKNPVVMRSLTRMRALINRLLQHGKIDEETIVHIELARDLNDANKRKALTDITRDGQKKHDEIVKRLKEYIANPTDADILKYQLWEEQGGICLYTNKTIGISDFVGNNPKFDIEHTIPRSQGGDSTKENLTLCDSYYNRTVKRDKLPSQLDDGEEILSRVARIYAKKADELDKQIKKIRTAGCATKEQKDRLIVKRLKLQAERDYYRGKYKRFEMTEAPKGFSRSQGVDNSIISKYACLYLKSLFKHVSIVKGLATAEFRKIYGIQDEYTKKERVNHIHHCIDAIVIACVGKREYDKLAEYYKQTEDWEEGKGSKPHFDLPWSTFCADMKRIQDEVFVVHDTLDHMGKKGCRKIHYGKTVLESQGDSARGKLHYETFYGAIKQGEEIQYVTRKPLDSLAEGDIKNVVDDTVRDIILAAIQEHGSLKAAVSAGIWMNKEKGVPIKKVRYYASQVKNPLKIKKLRDESRKEYKRNLLVTNDSNYMMAIYVGKDAKGKEAREFKVVNNLQAVEYFKQSNCQKETTLVPQVSEKGYPLAYELKTGTMVLLYEKNPQEVWQDSPEGKVKRLYKVTGLATMRLSTRAYGILQLTYHQEARRSSDVKAKNGAYKNGEELRPAIINYHTQFNALVEGRDFEINEIGEITKIEK